MSEQLQLIAVSEVPEGASAEVVAEGRIFAVFNVEGQFHVLDGICPHAGGPLGKGAVDGQIVTCPWHGWQFDVTSGQHCLTPAICQTSYAASVVDGFICIDTPE